MLRRWTWHDLGPGDARVGRHHRIPHRKVAEAGKVTELMGEDGFEIVGFGMGAESGGSSERGVRIARVEVDVG